MYNDFFSIGGLTVHTYGLMTGLAIIAAYFSAEYRAKKKGLDSDQIFPIVIMCVVFGYACSKLLYLITILPKLIKDPSLFADAIRSGWVVLGGILGGILGGWIWCRHKKLNTLQYFDVGLPSVALAQAIGRIGCFFAGCCYGVETDGPFYLEFSHSEFAPNHVHLVPTQLLSSAGDFLLFLFLLLYDRKWKKKEGEVSAFYLILYSAGRFIIEFFRGDLIRGSVGPLSTSQFLGLFTLAAGIIMLLIVKKRPAALPAAASEKVTGQETAATPKAEASAELSDAAAVSQEAAASQDTEETKAAGPEAEKS